MSESILTPAGVASWAASRGVDCKSNPDFPSQLLLSNIKGSSIPVRVAFLSERSMVWLQVELSDVIPRERYAAIAVAITLLNATIYLGSWGFLTQTGKLIFKVTLPTQGAAYGSEALEAVLQMMLGTVQATARRLGAVAFKGADPGSVVPKAG